MGFVSTWLSTLTAPRRRATDLAKALKPREREWLRQALALAILEYNKAMWEQDAPHAERIEFLQRLLKNVSENR